MINVKLLNQITNIKIDEFIRYIPQSQTPVKSKLVIKGDSAYYKGVEICFKYYENNTHYLFVNANESEDRHYKRLRTQFINHAEKYGYVIKYDKD